MSLTYSGTFTVPNQVQDAVPYDAGNGILLIDNFNSFKYYTLNTSTLVASATSAITPIAISLITAASAVVVGSGSTVEFYNISNGYRTSVASPANLKYNPAVTSGKNQQIASDTSLGIAFCTNANLNTITKINTSPSFSASSVSIPDPANFQGFYFTTIILKTSGRWLCGTTTGQIIEIDQNGVVKDHFELSIQNNRRGFGAPNGFDLGFVTSMAYDNNILMVTTYTTKFLIDWSTKAIIRSVPLFGSSSGLLNYTLSNIACGLVLESTNVTIYSGSVITETDFTCQRLKTVSNFISNNTAYSLVGINITSRIFWGISGTKVIYGAWSPRGSTLANVSVVGNPICRYLVIDDTAGTGGSFIVTDTVIQSPGTYRVPSGRTLMELIKVDSGATAQFDMSRYST